MLNIKEKEIEKYLQTEPFNNDKVYHTWKNRTEKRKFCRKTCSSHAFCRQIKLQYICQSILAYYKTSC